MTHWTHTGRLAAAGALALALLASNQASAATFSGYTGTLNAFASAAGEVSNQSIPISSGPYSLTANASAPPGSGIFVSAEGDATADLEAESLSLHLSGGG